MIVVLFQLFEIDAPMKIPSVNSMYKPRSVLGKSFAWLYKDEKVEAYQNLIVSQARKGDFQRINDYIQNVLYVDVEFIFLLDKNFYKRDTSNMIKMTEDALMKITEIDDSKHRKVTAMKALSHIPKKEYIICKYEVHYEDQ